MRKKYGIVVLSLFDGMGCGREALKRAGIPVAKYYASEIDKNAIFIAKKNHPDIVHIGDVKKVKIKNLKRKPDLVIGGSPCQGFSFAGKMLLFDDERSKLYFEFERLAFAAKKANPRARFFLENVKMKKEALHVITERLGVEPVLINSALVSAQNRERYYWADWEIRQPKDRGILLKDVIVDGEADRDRDKSLAVIASIAKASGPCDAKRYLTRGIHQHVKRFEPEIDLIGKKRTEKEGRANARLRRL